MLSIVIPTLNRPDSLVKLVDSLERQIIERTEFEILVVYNDPAEAQKTPLQEHSGLKILSAPQPGVNFARNRGAQAARGDVVLFIDDDCVAEDPYFLQKHIGYHQSFPQTMALGGPYQIPSSASLWDRIYQQNNLSWLGANRVSETQTFALLGGNTSYKATVFKNGFQFTEEITYGGSETPLNTLLSLKYGPLGYFEDLVITHQTSLGTMALWQKAYRQGKGAAVQTKLFGHQLQQSTDVAKTETGFVRWGLELYGFLFMTSYKSHLLKKKMFLVLVQEFWSRFVLKKKETLLRRYEIAQQRYTGQARAQLVHVYWWQHARIRHPIVMGLNRLYWWLHARIRHPISMGLNQLYWMLRHRVLKIYFFFHHLFCSSVGFIVSLTEPLPAGFNSTFGERLQLRAVHVSKKMAWLCLKTVGFR